MARDPHPQGVRQDDAGRIVDAGSCAYAQTQNPLVTCSCGRCHLNRMACCERPALVYVDAKTARCKNCHATWGAMRLEDDDADQH